MQLQLRINLILTWNEGNNIYLNISVESLIDSAIITFIYPRSALSVYMVTDNVATCIYIQENHDFIKVTFCSACRIQLYILIILGGVDSKGFLGLAIYCQGTPPSTNYLSCIGMIIVSFSMNVIVITILQYYVYSCVTSLYTQDRSKGVFDSL